MSFAFDQFVPALKDVLTKRGFQSTYVNPEFAKNVGLAIVLPLIETAINQYIDKVAAQQNWSPYAIEPAKFLVTYTIDVSTSYATGFAQGGAAGGAASAAFTAASDSFLQVFKAIKEGVLLKEDASAARTSIVNLRQIASDYDQRAAAAPNPTKAALFRQAADSARKSARNISDAYTDLGIRLAGQ